MDKVTIPPIKYVVIPALGMVAFTFQDTAATSTRQMALMVALATMLHMAAMTLRDAEFRALTNHTKLNAKDILAYGASVLFDALLLFGLITGAGHLMPWGSFLTIAFIVTLLMPPVIFVITRAHFAPAQARPGIRAPHMAGAMLLVVIAIAFWAMPAVQVPAGNQPFCWLVLLSAINAPMDSATRFAGTARLLRYAVLIGTMTLLLWNYLNIA